MSLNFLSIPPKKLSQSITSASLAIKLNNIKSWKRNSLGVNINLTAADFGTTAYGCFRNDTGTKIEIFSFDPATIASASITILKRGLDFNGDLTTETTAYKLDWSANETTVQLGTDVPQLFQYLKEYIDAAAIAGSVPASTTAKGIVELATQAELDAGTSTGGTGAPLFASPDLIRAKKYHDYAADAGSNDTYVITVTPAPAAYAVGQVFTFKANTVNTGAATLNVNGLGAKTIKKIGGASDLTSGNIAAGQDCIVIYDGTNFQLASNVPNSTSYSTTEFTSSGTYTKSAGLKYAIVLAIGPGGSGGSGNGSVAGGGGGGGAINSAVIPASLIKSTETVTVGTGGAAKVSNNQNGDSGSGASSFGSLLSAGAGAGGLSSTTGGAGGTATGGIAGGAGGNGGGSGAGGGGGGGAGGATTSTGGTSTGTAGGTAGPAGTNESNLGNGGVGATYGGAGVVAATNYGGGGGGGAANTGGTPGPLASGAGKDGYVSVTEFF